jgi:hypothetical protein
VLVELLYNSPAGVYVGNFVALVLMDIRCLEPFLCLPIPTDNGIIAVSSVDNAVCGTFPSTLSGVEGPIAIDKNAIILTKPIRMVVDGWGKLPFEVRVCKPSPLVDDHLSYVLSLS